MKKRLGQKGERSKKWGPLLLCFGLLAVVFLALVGKPWLERTIARKISGPCGPECLLTVQSVHLGWGEITLSDFFFRTGHPKLSQWKIEAPHLFIRPNWGKALRKEASFRAVRLESPRLRLEEGEEKPSGAKAAPPDFYVGSLEVDDGLFQYRKTFHGRKGMLTLDQIQVRAAAFGTRNGAEDLATQVKALARLEKSGKVEVAFQAKLFQSNPDLHFHLSVSGQNLPSVNSYFQPVDGIELKGHLFEAKADLHSDGVHGQSAVFARYNNLDVQFLQVEERSPVATILSNLLKGLKLKKGNLGDASMQAKGDAEITRKPQEAMVPFVLRGLKEAVLKVAAP